MVGHNHPGDGSGGDGGGGGGGISEWSSTIGIVTAIAGNVLISFALNIQRYAHIRINRERLREQHELRRKRRNWSSTSASRHTIGGYGALESLAGDNHLLAGNGNINHNYNNNTKKNGSGSPFEPGVHSGLEGASSSYVDNPEHMQRSFASDRTVTSLDKHGRVSDRKSYLHSSYWWAGLILMIIGESGNFLAYGFAPASIVSPLGVVAIISNCVIAPIMLKEYFRQRDLWGVIVAVAGAVTVVLSAKNFETKIGPNDIWGLITTWEFELYFGITVALILTLMWTSEQYGGKTILIDLGLVGLFGGYTALSTKGVSSLLSYTLWHVITFPITYLLVAVLAVSAMMQIKYINRALQRFDSTQVIPTQFVLFTISVIIGSAVLYRDFESATLDRSLKFVGGCCLTFLGVYFITSAREPTGDELELAVGDDEETVRLLDSDVYSNPDRVEDTEESASTARVAGRRDSSDLLTDEEEDIIDGNIEDRTHTPRAHLSSSSSINSISDTSSLLKSRPETPKQEPLVPNPWAPGEGGVGGEYVAGESTGLDLPSTRDVYPPPTEVVLQFPSAPGPGEEPSFRAGNLTPTGSPVRKHPSSPPKHTTPQSRRRKSAAKIAKTPQSASRAPLSLRFSPGPLSQPLSQGLSVVVADSLRRGEQTPEKQPSRSKSHRRKGKKPRTGNADGGHPHGFVSAPGEEADYETDDSSPPVEEGQYSIRNSSRDAFGGQLYKYTTTSSSGGGTSVLRPSFVMGSPSRRNSTRTLPTISQEPQAQQNGHRNNNHDQGDDREAPRVRSLSNTWSEGLGRLGDSVRFWKKKQRPSIVPSQSPEPPLGSEIP